MGKLLIFLGLIGAGVAGAFHFGWYSIFVMSFIITIGHMMIRQEKINYMKNRGVKLVVAKTVVLNTTFLAVLTAPIYFATNFFFVS